MTTTLIALCALAVGLLALWLATRRDPPDDPLDFDDWERL
jgi:hypothetical protein